MQCGVEDRGQGHGGLWRRHGRVQDWRRARDQDWLAPGSFLSNQYFSVRGRHRLRCWADAGKCHDPTVTSMCVPRVCARTRATIDALTKNAAQALAGAGRRGAAVGVGGAAVRTSHVRLVLWRFSRASAAGGGHIAVFSRVFVGQRHGHSGACALELGLFVCSGQSLHRTTCRRISG